MAVSKRNPNLRKSNRSEVRIARYKHLLELGFSVKEARRRRDTSATNIENFTERERVRITAVRSNRRSDGDKKIIRSIRTVRRRNQVAVNKVDSAPRLKPQSERLNDFKEWTAAGDFPDWAEQYIKKQNKKQDLDPFDGYGYRRFYYRYVDGDSEDYIDEEGLADRDNSGAGNPE